MIPAPHDITGSYDYSLIILSAFLAVFVMYTCTELSRRIASTPKPHQKRWIIAGALVLGLGVWASQIVGMLSLSLPSSTQYNLRITILTLLFAILAASLLFGITLKNALSYKSCLGIALVAGLLVTGMNFTNLTSIQTGAEIHYRSALILVSALLATFATAVILLPAFRLNDQSKQYIFQIHLSVAIISGLLFNASFFAGIASMHVIKQSTPIVSYLSTPYSLTAFNIGAGTLFILWTVILFSRWHVKEGIKIAARIAGLAFGLVFVTASTIGIIFYSSSKDLLTQKELESQSTRLSLENIQLQTIIDSARQDALVLAYTPPIQGIIRAQYARGLDPTDGSTESLWHDRLAAIFSGFLMSKSNYLKARYIGVKDNGLEIISVVKKNLSILRSSDDKLAHTDAELFFKSAKNKPYYKAYISETRKFQSRQEHWGTPGSKLTIPVSVPISDDTGKLFGIVVIDLDFGEIIKSVLQKHALLSSQHNVLSQPLKNRGIVLKAQSSEYFTEYFTDNKGNILLSANVDKSTINVHPTNTKKLLGVQKIQDIYPIIDSIINSKNPVSGYLIFEHSLGSQVINYQRIILDKNNQQSFLRLTVTPYSKISGIISPILNQFAIIVLVMVSMSAMLALLFSRVITKPLKQITQASRQFSTGKTNFTLPEYASGEFGTLARAFREMVTQVNDRNTAAKQSEQFIRDLVNSAADGLITMDEVGNIASFNTAAESIFGYAEEKVIHHNIILLMPERFRTEYETLLREYTTSSGIDIKTLRINITGLRHNEDEFPVELSINPVNSSATPLFICIVRDVSIQKASETTLRLANQVMNSAPEGIIITDTDSIIVRTNPAFEEITGYCQDDVLGKKASLLKSGRHNNQFYQTMWKSINDYGIWQGEIWDKRKSGEVYPKWLSISAIKDDDNSVTHYVGIFSDITERKDVEKRLEHLAHYDTLTGLPNRTLFHDRLLHSLEFARRSNKGLAVMMLDLDRFKIINDTLGHDIGDMLLVEAAKRLKNCLRKVDTVARMGGDEFTIILSELNDTTDATQVAQVIINTLSKPFQLAGHDCFVGVSIGISSFPTDGESPKLLTKHADTAMYRAKQAGRNTYQLYTHSMGTQNAKRLDIESKLRSALQNNELDLYYQPQIDVLTGKICGMEALLRWHHAEIGMIPPSTFIPIAEESGLILEIGKWILMRVCQQYSDWRSAGLASLSIMVNISAPQVLQSNFASDLHKMLEESSMPPEKMTLEITESTIMESPSHAIPQLEKLSALGVQLSIDDFGTGYSSMGQLNKLPIHSLKIDQSFIHDINEDENSQEIIKAMIAMAHNLGLRVTAEGVETLEQFEFLKQLNCNAIQGFLYSPPLPLDAINHLLTIGASPDLLSRKPG